MFGFGAATRIYVATGAIDMRKGFNGLYGIVRNRFAMDPESGHLFLFSNAKRDRMKVLYFDGSPRPSDAARASGTRGANHPLHA